MKISYYLPQNQLSNSQLSKEFPEWSVEKISSKTGIFNRHIAETTEFSSDLALKAATQLFLDYSIDKAAINFLILCTQSPDYLLPTTACILQDRLGLSKQIGAFDFNLGCSGFIYGLAVAKGLIAGGLAKQVLFITAETYSKFINIRDKNNRTIFGDAAAATLIDATDLNSIGEFVFGTDGSGYEHLIVKNSGIKFNDSDTFDEVDNNGNFVRNSKNLYMNGSAIFNFTATKIPILVAETLKANNLLIDDIDLFIFHQANAFMLNFIKKKMMIPDSKFFISMENCGNTVSSTIPIALKNAIGIGKIKKGNKVLLAGFGVGLSWGATIVQF